MNKKDGIRLGLRPPKKISDCLQDDREEELSFFRDIQKRGKEQLSLLQPVPDELDANGNYGLHRMEPIGRKGTGLEFLGEATAKNDYNWLKTPPATPLFPSLEMETNGQEMITQKEIPIIQLPLSRFAGEDKSANTRSNSKIVPPRYKARPPTISSTDKKTLIPIPKSNINPHIFTKTTEMEEKKAPNFLAASNLTESMLMADPKPSTTRRGLSPSVKPRIPAQTFLGFSDETPETTNRPESAITTRGRPRSQNASKQTDFSTKARGRQSCSPSVTRGRKAEAEADDGKVRHKTGNGTQVLGSRMVEKLMNARISNAEQRQGKIQIKQCFKH